MLFLVDGATISIFPILKMFVLEKNLTVAILELVDCQGHLADGGENDGTSIYNWFF